MSITSDEHLHVGVKCVVRVWGVWVCVCWYTNKHVLRVQTHSSHCQTLKKYVWDI